MTRVFFIMVLSSAFLSGQAIQAGAVTFEGDSMLKGDRKAFLDSRWGYPATTSSVEDIFRVLERLEVERKQDAADVRVFFYSTIPRMMAAIARSGTRTDFDRMLK